MRVLLVSTFKNYGGASVCTTRLIRGLIKKDIHVDHLYVLEKKKTFGNSVLKSLIGRLRFWINFTVERLVIKFSLKNRNDLFQYSTGNGCIDITKHPLVEKADIIHLHWINFSFLSVKGITSLAELKPLVWTMHDMWPFTGGCHYSYDCKNYIDNCSDCFYLSRVNLVSSMRLLDKKERHWKEVNFSLIGVSTWISSLAVESNLFRQKRVVTINNPIDTEVFKPSSNSTKSESFNLLFGAVEVNDNRKGFNYLLEALRELTQRVENIELTIFGSFSEDSLNGIDCKINLLGPISSEEEMVNVYSEANVFILPSIQETLSYTVMEAMACGTPVVAFDCGGVTDLVIHKDTGYLAANKDVNDLVEGVIYFTNKEKSIEISERARKHIEGNFSDSIISDKHIELYKELINDYK